MSGHGADMPGRPLRANSRRASSDARTPLFAAHTGLDQDLFDQFHSSRSTFVRALCCRQYQETNVTLVCTSVARRGTATSTGPVKSRSGPYDTAVSWALTDAPLTPECRKDEGATL